MWFLSEAIFKQEVKQTISHESRIPGVAGGRRCHSALGDHICFYYEFKATDPEF